MLKALKIAEFKAKTSVKVNRNFTIYFNRRSCICSDICKYMYCFGIVNGVKNGDVYKTVHNKVI